MRALLASCLILLFLPFTALAIDSTYVVPRVYTPVNPVQGYILATGYVTLNPWAWPGWDPIQKGYNNDVGILMMRTPNNTQCNTGTMPNVVFTLMGAEGAGGIKSIKLWPTSNPVWYSPGQMLFIAGLDNPVFGPGYGIIFKWFVDCDDGGTSCGPDIAFQWQLVCLVPYSGQPFSPSDPSVYSGS